MRRWLALLLLAAAAATAACGRVGPPVRRTDPAPSPPDAVSADESSAEQKNGDEENSP